MNIKRILAIILCAVMLVSFVACVENGGNVVTPPEGAATSDTSSGDNTPETDAWGREWIDDEISEDIKFAGETLKFLARKDTSGRDRWSIDFYAEGDKGTVMDNAIYSRNEKVADRLAIDYELTIEDGSYNNFDIYATRIETSYESGDHAYDVVGTYSLYGAQFATKGYFYNVLELESKNHLNLDKVWWNQGLKEDLTIDNKLYMLVGDINTTALTRMMAVFFNQSTVKNSYGNLNLYDVVNDGEWTMDYLIELIAESHKDMNGNSSADSEDFYGLVTCSPSESYDSIGAGMDVKIMERGNDGTWSFTSNTEILVNKIQKGVDLYWAGNDATRFYALEDSIMHFANDGSHFLIATLDKAMETTLTNMTNDFGVLPLPKYDTQQKLYRTTPQDAYNLISVMADVQNPDMVSAALELLCAESYRSVTPKLFEEVLKIRYMRDYESSQMLDYLREGITLDFATVNTLSLGDCGRWFRNTLANGKANSANVAASGLKITSKIWNKNLEQFIKDYEAIEN